MSDDLAEDFAGVDIFQPDVGVDGGLHVAVAEELSDELVLARAGLENESACGVPELMYCDPQPGRLINPVCDLAAEQDTGFGAAVQCLGDLAQGRGPVAPGLFRKLVRSRDDRDGVEERRSRAGLGFGSLGSAPRRLGWMGMAVSIFYGILGIRQCNTDYQYLRVRS